MRGALTPARLAFALLLALALPLFVAFAWIPGLATVGDDSVSYLLQARIFAGDPDPRLRQWHPYGAHFPPAFPMLLAATGAAHDFLRAHLVVAVCAALALIAVRSFAVTAVGGGAATFLVLLFLLMPTTWISVLGILSEPLFLLLTFAVLALNARQPEPRTGMRWLLGCLMGVVVLTRTAGVALVAAYGAWAAVRVWRRQEPLSRLMVPLVPVVLLVLAWVWLRPPLQGEGYGEALRREVLMVSHDPGFVFGRTLRFVSDAWVASFTSASHVHPAVRTFFFALGAVAVAGAVRAAMRNRLDGWYALAYLAMLLSWLFNEETMRRLIFPLLPLLLLHAGEMLYAMARRVPGTRPAWAPALAGVAAALLALPALLLVADKSRDRARPFEDSPQSLSQITEYYTTIPVKPAREMAGSQLSVLAGLQAIERATPPDAPVMWMRPDYVVLLAHRRGVPWYYHEGLTAVLRRVQDEGVQYIVVSRLLKSDMLGGADKPEITDAVLAPFAQAVLVVNNPAAPQPEFALMRFDRSAVAAYLASGAGSASR